MVYCYFVGLRDMEYFDLLSLLTFFILSKSSQERIKKVRVVDFIES